MAQFSAEKLLDCLDNPKLFTTNFKEFKQAFAGHQQHIIHPSFCLLRDKLQSEIGHPMNKLHILRAIKEGVDTGSFAVLQFVEAEILPIIEKISLYKSESPDPDRGKTLFLDQLKQPSLKGEYQKIGNSYLRFVLECIEVWATIKPYFVSGTEEIESIPSGYAILYQNLKKEGVNFCEKKSYYKEQDFGKFRKVFIESLKRTASKPEQYSDYYAAKMSKALETEQAFKETQTQTIINMMLIPDFIIEQNTLEIIQRNLANKSSPPIPKILSLKLLCELFHSGSINVLDHTQSYILPILMKTVKELDGEVKGLARGGRLAPNNTKLGEKLYLQILKSIILLGESCPRDPLTGQQTHLKKAVNELNGSGYELPVVVEVADFKADYQQNLLNIKRINTLFKRKKQLPYVTIFVVEPANTQPKRFIIPRFDPLTDIHETISILKSIYRQFKTLDPNNEAKDKKWISEVVGYLNLYNNNIDTILEENIDLSDFDAITNEAYLLLQKNININEQLQNKIAYDRKLLAIKSIIDGDETTPSPPPNPTNIISKSAINSQPKIIPSQPPKQKSFDMRALDKSMSVELKSQPDLKSSLLQIPEIKREQMSYQNKSVSSYDRKLQEKQKIQEIEVIAQYEKEHYNSRRLNSQEKVEEIEFREKPKSSNVLDNSSEQKSFINSILDDGMRSQASEPNIPKRHSQSLLSNNSVKMKNKIGMRRIDDSQSFDDSMSVRSRDDDRKPNDLLFIKESIIQSKSIGSQNVIQRDNKSELLLGEEVFQPGMAASFGNPAFITRNQPPEVMQYQNMDFKKKSKVNMSVREEPPVQITYAQRGGMERGGFERGDDHVKQSNNASSLKSSNLIKRSNVREQPFKTVTYEQESEIIEPGIQPLGNSYYQPQAQIKEQILKVTSAETPQFNDCFEAQKYLIPSKNFGGEAKKYWLQQDAKMLTTFNKSVGEGSIKSQARSNIQGVSVPEIIAQHNKHFEVQIQGVRDQHKKEVQFLENKIRKLEKHNKQQEKALSEQKSQIESLRGGLHSEINLGATYKSHQQEFLESENMVLRNRLENQTKSHLQSRNLSPIKTISDQFLFSRQKFNKIPKGDTFPSQPYQQFLSTLSDLSMRKQMIKNKDLLIKNQNLEVGFIISKENNCLRVALFFQSETKQLVDIRINLNNKGLNLETYPEVFPRQMKEGKQERYVIALFVADNIKIPYQIPEIQMSYRVKDRNQAGSVQFPIPLTFNRLLEYSEIDPVKFKQIYKQNAQYITRGEQISYNKKILRDISSIRQILPKLQIINPYKQAQYLQGNAVIKFGVKATFEPLNSQFLIKVNVKPGCYLYFQTIPLSKPSANRIPEQLLISTMNHLVRKERLW